MRITAIFAVYNEEQIIARAIEHLKDQGVEAYVVDNESTDGTRSAVEGLVGRGVVGVETLPRAGYFRLEDQLRRKEELHQELGSDWYIHHDADEIRQAPNPYRTLADGIAAVDAVGYNAIDFSEFLFMPTSREEDFDHEDYVEQMRYYCYFEPPTGARFRINAWKNYGQRIDLTSSGGHQVRFEGRRVFPMKFILRHYIARSYNHVVRKYCDRKYCQEELAKGWSWTRATLKPDEVHFPTRSQLKELAADNTWDTSEPWTEEPIFKNAFHPPLPSRRRSE